MKDVTLHFDSERTVQRAYALAAMRCADTAGGTPSFTADERPALEILAQEAVADLAVELAAWLVALDAEQSAMTLRMPDEVNSLSVMRLIEQTIAQRLCGIDAPSAPVKRALRGSAKRSFTIEN